MRAWAAFAALLLLTTAATLIGYPTRLDHFIGFPPFLLVGALLVAAIAYVQVSLAARNPLRAFLSSGVAILSLMAILGITLFPNMVIAANDPSNSLTIYNSSSSQMTLWIMLILVAIGLPIVLAYTAFIYRLFLRQPAPAGRIPLSDLKKSRKKQPARARR